MTTFYSVIRYVPNPLAEESINIGIVATAGAKTEILFLKDWKRVRSFANEDLSFLQDFKNSFVTSPPDESKLRSVYCRWSNSIQFSDLRPSTNTPEVAIERMARIYLHPYKVATVQQNVHGKPAVLNSAFNAFHETMSTRSVCNPRKMLKKKCVLEGHSAKHTFDIAMVNGRPYMGAYAFSFGIQHDIEKNVDAAAYAIEDIRKGELRDLPVILIAESPSSEGKGDYIRAKRIFDDLNAQILKPLDIPRFANEIIDKLPKTLFETK